MSRQRVSKGQVFQKSDEKIIKVLMASGKGTSDDILIDNFISTFPDDWAKIIKRYDEHERLTPPGKSHPMAPPRKYLINKFRKHRLALEGGADLAATLAKLQAPKPLSGS